MKKVKAFFRRIIRQAIRSRDTETIHDSLDRIKAKAEKVFFRKKYSCDELREALKDIGIREGDTVYVTTSWRRFFNFQGTPEDLISILESLVGESGTIAMACFTIGKRYLDVKNSPSAAGVLTEIFRKTDGVKRSACTHFSVAAKGRNAEYLTGEHCLSDYGFDAHSPLYKLTTIPNAKLLFLGLGSLPVKLPVAHCAGAALAKTDPKMKAALSLHKHVVLIDEEGRRQEKDMLARVPGHGYRFRVGKNIAKSAASRRTAKLSNLDIVLIDADDCYNTAIEYIKNRRYGYDWI